MRLLFTAALAALHLGLSTQTASADDPVVIELYTSQGCSSCPPADKLLGQLAKRKDVLPLALHVDYWDYIGWKDIFANPDYTLRQRAYARAGARRMIYTPQMIIGGGANVEGARPMEVMDEVRAARREMVDVDLRLTLRGDRLTIRADRTNLDGPVSVQLVRYVPTQTVDVLRGENRGRSLTYTNIVTSWETLEEWNGKSALSLPVTVKGDMDIAVILQQDGPSRIIAAATLN